MITQPGLLVVGIGGMGLAIARRLGSGRRVVCADNSIASFEAAVTDLKNDGIEAEGHQVDVSDLQSVSRLAESATAGGPIGIIVHTAGISPVTGVVDRILQVDLQGTANVIDVFRDHLMPGGSMVCIASMAANFVRSHVPADLEKHLATGPLDQLLSHKELEAFSKDPATAYAISKRANQLRVEYASIAYGERGCRINSVSPGVIYTPMIVKELEASTSVQLRELVSSSPAKRYGTPQDVAQAVEFLCSPAASFVTGSDLLEDGGSTAMSHFAQREES